jgi:glycosyltransferase involved in cell wall biosynthesis
MESNPGISRTLVTTVIPVFRNAAGALNAAHKILSQDLPHDILQEIIIIDDGSMDGGVEHIRQAMPRATRLIELPTNMGRSAARQTGLNAARGNVVLFLDCDCEPVDERFIAAHLTCLKEGSICSTGPITGFDKGFWDRYQQNASARRRRKFESGMHYVGSTANMMARTESVRSAGGFDMSYRGYGFEDRALLIRLAEHGKVTWCDKAIVRHLDRISMLSVSTKMRDSARDNSRKFATQFPKEYRDLGYAALDARLRTWLRLPGVMLAPLLKPISRIFDVLEGRGLVPWSLGTVAVRIISAASFLAGTCETRNNE